MKFLSVLAIGFLFFNQSFSQSLEGEWKGSFTDASIAELTTTFALYFTPKKGGSYKVHTYTRVKEPDGISLIIVCEATCTIISADSIVLEEIKQVKPKSSQTDHLQRIYLTIRVKDNKKIMEGWWEGANDKKYGGTMLLTKK